MSEHIDYEKEAKLRMWWLNGTGGAAKDSLTVRDYFAAKSIGVMITLGLEMDKGLDLDDAAEVAYSMADAMMKARILDNQGEL